jgi:branched-chain amino acid transport system ATP-binding protein
MSDVVLKITDLNAHYGHIHALRGVSLEVKAGQIVTLLGANGAGKSTTMKCISGLLKPTGGKIEFMGESIFGKPAHDIVKRGLIHVPEGRRIFKGMTIQENLELGSYTLKDDPERKKRMDHVYELFPVLHERRNRDAGLLSGGEQQMLAMGRALMVGQKLVLLDEPSMGLAPFLVKDIMKVVKRLNEEGITILLVEQNAKMALGVADYGYVVETGEIVMHDAAEVLKNDERIINAYLGE